MTRTNTLKITHDGKIGSVHVDQHEIGHAVAALDFTARPGEFPIARIELVMPAVDFEGQAELKIGPDTRDALVALGWTPPDQGGPRCQYCGADCSGDRNWDGGDRYLCPRCADDRAARRGRFATEAARVEWGYRYVDTPQGYSGPMSEEGARQMVSEDLSRVLLRRQVRDGSSPTVGAWEDVDTDAETPAVEVEA